MADEESEIRRMAEIADAINAILDADPVGDTPAQGAPMARDEAATSENTSTETVEATDDMPDDSLAANDANDAIAPDAQSLTAMAIIMLPMISTPQLLLNWDATEMMRQTAISGRCLILTMALTRRPIMKLAAKCAPTASWPIYLCACRTRWLKSAPAILFTPTIKICWRKWNLRATQ